MKSLTRNIEQQIFQDNIRSVGCPITDDRYNIQLHHVVGRSYVQNKIPIGHWFVLPLHFILHDVSSDHPCNVTHFRHQFVSTYGTQVELYLKCLNKMEVFGMPIPDTTIIEAIKSTSY